MVSSNIQFFENLYIHYICRQPDVFTLSVVVIKITNGKSTVLHFISRITFISFSLIQHLVVFCNISSD